MAKQPHRILVVGDEPDVAEVLAAGLEVMGFEVTVASSGDEALLRLSEEAFEAMLTDVHMPRMRGDELQRRARAADPDLAVLMITAASDASLAVECLKEGVFDYMAKPFNLKDVAARVEKAIERRALIQENRAHQSDLEARVAEQASEIEKCSSPRSGRSTTRLRRRTSTPATTRSTCPSYR